MLEFNYDEFKAALKAAELKKYEELKEDMVKVKACIEKMMVLMFENTANIARTEYQGIDL